MWTVALRYGLGLAYKESRGSTPRRARWFTKLAADFPKRPEGGGSGVADRTV
jgi:hypothetical protein